MKVKNLVEFLQRLPMNATVYIAQEKGGGNGHDYYNIKGCKAEYAHTEKDSEETVDRILSIDSIELIIGEK